MKKQTTKLHFTGEDLRNESVKKAAEKAEKAAGKADEAKARLPSRKLRTKKASAEAEGAKLRFGKKEIVEEVKAPTALKQKVIMKGAVKVLSFPQRLKPTRKSLSMRTTTWVCRP